MKPVGIMSNDDGKDIIFNLIVDMDSVLMKSVSLSYTKSTFQDIMAYRHVDIETELLYLIKDEKFIEMSVKEIQTESTKNPLFKIYLRDYKIDQILNRNLKKDC